MCIITLWFIGTLQVIELKDMSGYMQSGVYVPGGVVGSPPIKVAAYHSSIIIFIDEESKYWNSKNFKINYDEESGMQYIAGYDSESLPQPSKYVPGYNKPVPSSNFHKLVPKIGTPSSIKAVKLLT
jgi:hypothetical protein